MHQDDASAVVMSERHHDAVDSIIDDGAIINGDNARVLPPHSLGGDDDNDKSFAIFVRRR